MNLVINGNRELQEVESLNVLEILKLKDVEMPEMVSVQLNGVFVDKDKYEATLIKDNDEIDFLYFMGGGEK